MLGSRSQRHDLLKSMKVFKTSIMQVMKTFFRIIDRTKELELCVYNNRVARSGCKQGNGTDSGDNRTNTTAAMMSTTPQLYQIPQLYRYDF